MITNEELILRCIQLAQKGKGSVSPNPLVGCVIVKNNGIIGEGYHSKYGDAHAEVNAIRSSAESVEGADVYVNLEPCNFFGKTPPCTDLLIEKDVRKVFVAMLDPNPRVNGSGVKKLREAGIEVEVGIMEHQARKLNESFIKFITKKIPFAALKVAQSFDGKIALSGRGKGRKNGKSKYITSKESLTKVHELRAEYDAVLVGAGTINADDPELTVRLVGGRSPIKIVIDGNLSSPAESKVFGSGRTILFHSSRMDKGAKKDLAKITALKERGVELFSMKGDPRGIIGLKDILQKLAALNIASVLVEGGASVFSQFIESKLADKLHLFIAPKILGCGLSFADDLELKDLSKAPVLKEVEISQLGSDCMVTGYF
ncbi:MAG TPA: bifunctional diaminohydroxyphosphoribosylaminopyrimidine deaminase/5-amino-6-(5-phosphoribosylamino)uracil reductase RibD [Candidatus Acidoferrales bacterium]|nr:bifunctional diaminohydroxyphosphoribosylaminopyrimidine deaminase/5-amino-6-(5-phosphoribosylamino)uracil reductase RibD [Candidatus Acidoferrales bacterium]